MSDTDFEREKLCYEQNCEHARSLNRQMNQVPVLAVTLTGGLWLAGGLNEHLVAREIQFALIFFSGLCNLGLLLAAIRIRDVFESYIERIQQFYPDGFADGKPKRPRLSRLGSYSMISIYCLLILVAGVMSFVTAFTIFWPFCYESWIFALLFSVFLLVAYFMLFDRERAA